MITVDEMEINRYTDKMHKDDIPVVSTFVFLALCFCVDVLVRLALIGQASESFFYRYQTFIAGFFALVGAFLTVSAIGRQIAQVDRHEREAADRKAYLARSILPATLSELADYINVCFSVIDSFRQNFAQHGGRHSSFIAIQMPRVPAETLVNLRETVEHDDRLTAALVADLMAALQIFQARLRGTHSSLIGRRNSIVVNYTFDSHIVDAAEIQARISLLFPYARRQEGARLEQPNLAAILDVLFLQKKLDPSIEALATRRVQSGGILRKILSE